MSQFLFQEAMIELLEVDPSKLSIVDELKKQWCERMVKRFDEDRNGMTSVEEADVGIRTHIWRGFGRSKEESISVVDSNSDGTIDAGELHECLAQLKKSLIGRVTAMQTRPSDFAQNMRIHRLEYFNCGKVVFEQIHPQVPKRLRLLAMQSQKVHRTSCCMKEESDDVVGSAAEGEAARSDR